MNSELEKVMHIDAHWTPCMQGLKLYEFRARLHQRCLFALREAQETGVSKVLFDYRTGYDKISKDGKSIVTKLMRSKKSTPYVHKNKSISNDCSYCAVIKQPNKGEIIQ